jgi:hypothetical protein
MIYMKTYSEAIEYADEAVNSSKACIANLSKKLDQPVGKDPQSQNEYERLT